MLSFLNRFRKRKEKVAVKAKEVTELEKFLGDDKETYEALVHTIFLDPRKLAISMKEAVENAKKLEKADDLLRARVMYEIAGGLAIYEGNPKKVAEYFSEAERLDPEIKYPITKNPEKAVEKAQEYYKKYLK
jgi:hypothetical protein